MGEDRIGQMVGTAIQPIMLMKMKILIFSTFLFLSSFTSDQTLNKIETVNINNMELTVTIKDIPGDCTVTITGVCGSVSVTRSNCADARSAAVEAYTSGCAVK
jgi:hypothetical protein